MRTTLLVSFSGYCLDSRVFLFASSSFSRQVLLHGLYHIPVVKVLSSGITEDIRTELHAGSLTAKLQEKLW